MNTYHSCLVFLLGLIPLFLAAQDCGENRYLDPITNQVFIYSQQVYANADPYGPFTNDELPMDIYVPLNDTLSKRPVIIFMHGGAFLVGWEGQEPIPAMAEHFAKRGFVFASIEYRLGFNPLDINSSERAVYRAGQDLGAAMRFLAENADLYNIDTTRMIIGGTSAGAITSVQLAYFEENERPASSFGTFLEPSDLGCSTCSGNTDYNSQYIAPFAVLNFWGGVNDTLFINPPRNVPVFSMHGTEDETVHTVYGAPYGADGLFISLYGSVPITERLNSLGIYNELYLLNGAGHEPELDNLVLVPEYLDTMLLFSTPFLHKVLQPKTSAISGNEEVCQGETAYYEVSFTSGSSYCWNVTGGTIVEDNGNSIKIAWTQQGTHLLEVIEKNDVDAVGNAVSLNITVTDPVPTVDFTQELIGFTVTVTDLSTNFDSLTIDFGDGTTETTTQTSSVFNHTYSEAGIFVITISVSNDCTTKAYSEVITIEDVTAIQEMQDLASIYLVPSLAEDVVSIHLLKDNKVWNIQVFNTLGKLMKAISTKENQLDLTINGWNSGVYYVLVRNEDQVRILPFVR